MLKNLIMLFIAFIVFNSLPLEIISVVFYLVVIHGRCFGVVAGVAVPSTEGSEWVAAGGEALFYLEGYNRQGWSLVHFFCLFFHC